MGRPRLIHTTPIFGVQVLYFSDGTSVVKQSNGAMEGFSISVDHHIGVPEAASVLMTALRMEHTAYYQKYYARPGDKA